MHDFFTVLRQAAVSATFPHKGGSTKNFNPKAASTPKPKVVTWKSLSPLSPPSLTDLDNHATNVSTKPSVEELIDSLYQQQDGNSNAVQIKSAMTVDKSIVSDQSAVIPQSGSGIPASALVKERTIAPPSGNVPKQAAVSQPSGRTSGGDVTYSDIESTKLENVSRDSENDIKVKTANNEKQAASTPAAVVTSGGKTTDQSEALTSAVNEEHFKQICKFFIFL